MTILQEDADFLAHYGVKGMRWGVRKDQATSAVKSKVADVKSKAKTVKDAHQEKVAKKAEAQAALVGKSISSLDKQIESAPNAMTKNMYMSRKATLEAQQKVYLEEAKAAREGRLTDRQKQALKTAAIVGGVLAAYGLYNMAQSGELHQLKLRGESFLKGANGLSWKRKDILSDPNLSVDQIMATVVKPINPGYGNPGTKVNCRRATFAYEMRRRGFDVAATRTTNGRGQDINGLLNAVGDQNAVTRGGRARGITRYLKEAYVKEVNPSAKTPYTDLVMGRSGPVKKIPGGVKDIFSTLSEQPNGARGELGLAWTQGGAHSIAWEVVNGKAVLFDTQSGKKFMDATNVTLGLPSVKDLSYTRLDNVKLNDKFLQRWLKDA
jgi:hypothetical protein